jgi:hypothetical protein
VRLLLHGLDTVEAAYYFRPSIGCELDFVALAERREAMRAARRREPELLSIGGKEFLLASHGTASGYPFLMENGEASVQFGEFNSPSFFITYRSHALWHKGAVALHGEMLSWATAARMSHGLAETLSRVDFTFDFEVSEVDFDEDSFVTLAAKDAQHRKDRKLQTMRFGEGDLVLRVYDKSAEVREASQKTWFHDLWGGVTDNVWRVEFQVRKEVLRRFGIRQFQDLFDGCGDLLRHLVHDHTTLRVKGMDSNRSRWPLHPLWQLIQAHVNTLPAQGVIREVDQAALLKERMLRLATSVDGYLKRAAAIDALRRGVPWVPHAEALDRFADVLRLVHDPLTWRADVEKRVVQMKLGQW